MQDAPAALAWAGIADRVRGWLPGAGVAPRDAVVLVPFVQLLPLARRAFAAGGGLLPRIETTRTLAASLGPGAVAEAAAPTLDAAFDAVLARQMLAAQEWGAHWRRRDRRSFDRGAVRLVAAAHEVVAAMADVAPGSRGAWWTAVRASLGSGSGPGGRERQLARIAVEWAALTAPPATDRLFAARPAAWVAVQAGGSDPMVQALLAAASVPCLVVDTDRAIDESDPADAAGAPRSAEPVVAPAFQIEAGFEPEAQAAAARVLEHLRLGERPVALVAADRVVVRRIRALLERFGTRLVDETGWRLSTTRAAAHVMTLLAAAERQATSDQLFEWLKSGKTAFGGRALAALEIACRKQAIWRVAALADARLDDPEADAARRAALGVLAFLQGSGRRPIVGWLDLLERALVAAGAWPALQADDAGRQVIATLGLGRGTAGRARIEAASEPGALADFVQWVDEVLELATFVPPNDATDDAKDDAATDAGGEVDVVITPLARVLLRPFAAAVLPGADDRHLGAYAPPDSLLGAATRAALGAAAPADRQRAEWLAFGHLLRLPKVTLLRRASDGVEPLATSPFVDRLGLVLAARGQAWRPNAAPGGRIAVPAQPVRRHGPAAPGRVPERLSATSFDALRACPYRFFATRMLGAIEDAELDGDLEKRDYGSWLHDVLHTFHEARSAAPGEADADEAGLREAGEQVLARSAFDAAEFLPWSAAFEAFVPRYVRWLRGREQAGAHWVAGETERRVRPEQLEGTELRGIIDRIDAVTIDGALHVELIDYKTGNRQALKNCVKEPFEDTQLAFYAALMADEPRALGAPLKATYLALESRPELEEVPHEGVEASAAALIEGVAIDLRRLRAGAALMPLGEGDACKFCEARGLCRRDHWTADDEPAAGPASTAGSAARLAP